MEIVLLRMDCLTNMHVGTGDVGYSIIDNQVEKDPVLGVPEIHSSGIKGGFREYCEKNGMNKLDEIFGSETEHNNKKETKPGIYKFMNANMIARPMRVSDGEVSYIRTTSVDIINSHVELLHNFGITKVNNIVVPKKKFKILEANKGMVLVSDKEKFKEIEGIKTIGIQKSGELKEWNEFLKEIIEEDYAIMDSQMFLEQDLPVVARNSLDEKGISQNLWYEEIVPHKSIFYTFVLTLEVINEFLQGIDGKIMQFGGNASIGYGFTKVRSMKVSDNMENKNENSK